MDDIEYIVLTEKQIELVREVVNYMQDSDVKLSAAVFKLMQKTASRLQFFLKNNMNIPKYEIKPLPQFIIMYKNTVPVEQRKPLYNLQEYIVIETKDT